MAPQRSPEEKRVCLGPVQIQAKMKRLKKVKKIRGDGDKGRQDKEEVKEGAGKRGETSALLNIHETAQS